LSAEVGLLKWINKLKPLLDAYQEIFLNAGLDYLLLVWNMLVDMSGGNALGDP